MCATPTEGVVAFWSPLVADSVRRVVGTATASLARASERPNAGAPADPVARARAGAGARRCGAVARPSDLAVARAVARTVGVPHAKALPEVIREAIHVQPVVVMVPVVVV